MDNFIVSARKYRPVTFDTVIGQKSITSTLKNAIKNNHLAQAFLFCGPRGVGKTTCARILAKTINCKNISENIDACNECDSCLSFNESVSFNIHELDAASNNSVDDIRNLVEQVRIPPQVGKYKIYIIDEVHMLSASAFNAFLKTLEEPPAYAKFILATTEKHKIIPTILSRCQIYDFRRITIDDIAEHLAFVAKKEGVTADIDALHIIAQKADGSLRDALTIFDQIVSFTGNNFSYKDVIENLNVLDYDYYFRLTDFVLNNDITSTLLLINEIIDNGFDLHYFTIGIGEHLRNLLVCRDASTLKLLELGASIKDKYQEQALKCSEDFILKALDINNKCDINYKTSNNKRLLVELSLMQMCSILSHKEIPAATKKEQVIIPPEKDKIVTNTHPPVQSDLQSTLNKPTAKETSVQPEKKTAAVKMKTATISIKEQMSPSSKHEEDNKLQESTTEYQTANNFSQDDLKNVWDKYATFVAADFPSFNSILTRHLPVLKENFMIELTLDNKVQDDEINVKRTELLEYIRKELNNYKIQLRTVITESKSADKPYSPVEKYKKMVQKNPAINQLKNELGLELDF